jgi:hypothetical protein
MAMWVKVRNINPLGAVLTVLDGEAREVGAGEVTEVSPEQAGQPPRWRAVAAGEVVEGHQETREHAGRTEVYDLGAGLLAQVSNWEAVSDKADAETPKEKI